MKIKQQCISFKNSHGVFCLKIGSVYNFDIVDRVTGETIPAYELRVMSHTVNFIQVLDTNGRMEYINKDAISFDCET